VTGSRLKRWQRIVLWPPLHFVLPTATTLYYNYHCLRGGLKTANLPDEAWAHREAGGLLSRSEDRLRSLEAKGPGLATVAAVVAAGVVAAIIEGDDATLIGKVLLGLAVWYAAWSLCVPIYLVGPQRRETVDLSHVVAAALTDNPEKYIAQQAQKAAQGNVRRGQRIANLQDAARNELGAALAVLVLWLLLGPVTGLLERDKASPKWQPRPAGQAAPARPSSPPTTGSLGTTSTSSKQALPPASQRESRGQSRTTPRTGGAQAPG
jgi:hypothetical protein